MWKAAGESGLEPEPEPCSGEFGTWLARGGLIVEEGLGAAGGRGPAQGVGRGFPGLLVPGIRTRTLSELWYISTARVLPGRPVWTYASGVEVGIISSGEFSPSGVLGGRVQRNQR